MRGELLFVFNFHPTTSFTDYGIPVSGKFRVVLDTDDPSFGGFNRIDRKTIYISIRKAERNIINAPLYLYLYLPSRTALVFKKELSGRPLIFSQSSEEGRNPVCVEDLVFRVNAYPIKEGSCFFRYQTTR